MYIMIPMLVIVGAISFLLARRLQGEVVSEKSPFTFADDILVINTGAIFSVQSSNIERIELQYNPKAMKNKFYEMKIHIVKTDGNVKNIRYRGSRSGTQPQDMVADLATHYIKCHIKE